LGFSQFRIGPSKLILGGRGQPIFDGVKLLFKCLLFLWSPIKILYFFLPGLLLFLSFSLMILLRSFVLFKFWGLVFFCFLGGLSYYSLILGGVSNNKYSVMGGFRSVVVVLGFEVCVRTILFFFFIVSMGWVFEFFFYF